MSKQSDKSKKATPNQSDEEDNLNDIMQGRKDNQTETEMFESYCKNLGIEPQVTEIDGNQITQTNKADMEVKFTKTDP